MASERRRTTAGATAEDARRGSEAERRREKKTRRKWGSEEGQGKSCRTRRRTASAACCCRRARRKRTASSTRNASGRNKKGSGFARDALVRTEQHVSRVAAVRVMCSLARAEKIGARTCATSILGALTVGHLRRVCAGVRGGRADPGGASSIVMDDDHPDMSPRTSPTKPQRYPGTSRQRSRAPMRARGVGAHGAILPRATTPRAFTHQEKPVR